MNIEKRVAILENRSQVNFAGLSNKAMGLEDGNIKVELSPSHNAIYFATGRKPLSECIRFDVFDSNIKEVQGISFKDGREITGVVDSYSEDPTKVISAVALNEIESKLEEHEEKITENTNKIAEHDVSITTNTNKIADHEERIVDNTMYIYTLNGDVKIHEEKLTKNDEDVSNIITRLDYNESDLESTKSSLQIFMNTCDYNIEDHDKRITTNTKNIMNLENTKAEKTEVLGFDFLFPVGAIVTGYRPRIGTWTQICTYGSWFFESYYHYIYVVKTQASIEVSIYFRVPENLVYVLNFKKLTAKCQNPSMYMFDFRFDRITEDTMYGHIEEYPKIWRDSSSFAGGTVTMTSKIDLNYGYNNKQSVTLHFRFMRYQLQDYDAITASTFPDYVYFDTYGYDKTTADDSIYAYKRTE